MTPSDTRIRLLVVEDHTLVREALVAMVGQQADMVVVGEAASGEEALDAYRRLKPSVVLMDLRLPGMDGVAATDAIRSEDPDARVVVLTAFEGDELAHRALQAGARAYLWKDARREEMLRAIRAAREGRRWVAPAVAARIAESLPRAGLTPRELAVLERMAQGESNAEIARALSIAETTVKVHVGSILGRLGARDRTQAVLRALSRGIVRLRHGSS